MDPAGFSRWQMVDTDSTVIFVFIYFVYVEGMNEPLLPKAITAWAQAYFYADVTFLPFLRNKTFDPQDNLSQM